MSWLAHAWLTLSAAALVACGSASRAAPCSAAAGCGTTACVAGRCLSDAGEAALQSSRRIVLDPTDIALIQRGSSLAAGALPATATLGRVADGPGALLLRFDVPADAQIMEAYLLVEHGGEGATGGEGVGVHAERIVGPWEARSVTWRDGPELKDVHAPSFAVLRGSPATLRLDVKPLFLRPRGGEPPDQGIALVVDPRTANGLDVVVIPGVTSPLPGDPDTHDRPVRHAPRLELYVK